MLSWGCNHHDRWQTILSPLQQIIIKLDVLFSVLAVFSSIINVIIVIIFWMKFFNWYINNKVNNLFYRLSKIIHSFTNDSCKIFSWNQAIIFQHPFRLNAIALCFEMIQGVEKNAFFLIHRNHRDNRLLVLYLRDKRLIDFYLWLHTILVFWRLTHPRQRSECKVTPMAGWRERGCKVLEIFGFFYKHPVLAMTLLSPWQYPKIYGQLFISYRVCSKIFSPYKNLPIQD